MTISELTITQAELNEAVGYWLTTKHNITVPIENVRKPYSWSDWTIDIKRAEERIPVPVNATPITTAT